MRGLKGSILISSTVSFGTANVYRRTSDYPAGFLLPLSSTDALSCVDRITFGSGQRQKMKSIRHHRLPFQQQPSFFSVSSCLELKRGSTEDDKHISVPMDNRSIMTNLEREVRASAQATLDLKRVKDALTAAATTDNSSTPVNYRRAEENTSNGIYYGSSSSMTVLSPSNPISSDVPTPPPSQWKIALTAGLTAALASFLLLHQPLLSLACFLATTIVAARDPIDEGASTLIDGDDDLAGPLARTIGRAALQSIEGTTPKVRAITKAAVTGSAEIDSLRGRIRELEGENRDLMEWVEKRKYVDEHVGGFTLGELKGQARDEGLTVGGTKVQLMMRLAEAGCLEDLG